MTVDQLTKPAIASATVQRSIGEGRISVSSRSGKTRVADLYQKANAKIRIPKSHNQSLEAVLINTSGGMTGGDQLDWSVECGPNTNTIVTTQACEKIYRSQSGIAKIQSELKVESDASLEWLPQETILYDQGAMQRSIEIHLSQSARFLGLEAIVLGRQAMGETARQISLKDRWRIKRESRLIHADDIVMDDDIEAFTALPSVLHGCAAFATLIICWPDSEVDQYEFLLRTMRAAAAPSSHWSVNAIESKVVARFVAKDMYELRQTLVPVLLAASDHNDVPKVWRL